MKLKKKKVGIYMATITIERDGLNLVGTREEPLVKFMIWQLFFTVSLLTVIHLF